MFGRLMDPPVALGPVTEKLSVHDVQLAVAIVNDAPAAITILPPIPVKLEVSTTPKSPGCAVWKELAFMLPAARAIKLPTVETPTAPDMSRSPDVVELKDPLTLLPVASAT